MAPFRLLKEVGRLVGHSQKLAKRVNPASDVVVGMDGSTFTRTPSGVLVPDHMKLKTKGLGGLIDTGVDFIELNILERVERMAWIQFRFGLAGGAIIGTAAAMKYSILGLFSPAPFGEFIYSAPVKDVMADTSDQPTVTVEERTLNYQEVKALAYEINGKLLKQFNAGIAEAIEEGLVTSFSRDIVDQQRKLLNSTRLNKEQKEELESALMHSIVLEFKRLNLIIKNQESMPPPAATEG